MNDLLDKLLAFLGFDRDPSIEKITAPMAKIKAKLDRKIARHERLIEEKEVEKRRLEDEHQKRLAEIAAELSSHDNEASRAAVTAEKYAALAA